ncbi:threonylcarbamoyl-AMP synthase [Candidatus Kaiserbacteria bacterium]|nr:threonylcarbamoyl-AMP synthase [Candidatus Kaiserbacteria bacterium]
MEILKIAEVGVEEAAQRAAAVLRQGGVVLYPTDTLYGLGADALSDEAVARVRDIKGRDEQKPLHALVSNLAMAERIGIIDDMARHVLSQLPEGKVSLVVRKRPGIDTGITRGMETVGFRIPHNDFCKHLLKECSAPVTATSANIAGAAPARSLPGIMVQLAEAVAKIDLILDGGEAPLREPSTVLDISNPAAPVILREGAVPAADIWDALRISDATHG